MTDPTVLIVAAVGGVAGSLGALLGLSGGMFLVPFLILVVDLPVRAAVGLSLTTVIATSSVVSAKTAGRQLLNLRLAMLLQLVSTAGALTGGLTAMVVSERTVLAIFGTVAAVIAGVMLARTGRRNVIRDPAADPGRLGGRFYEAESGGVVSYRLRRLPVGLGAAFVAGNLASLIGIGGGIINVPVLNAWCGVPMRVAAATSAFLIGVTATAAVPGYYLRGDIVPHLAAAAVLGVLGGSRVGFWIGARSGVKGLKLLLALMLIAVSALMFARLR